jgi:alpha/beta superfamily hydrolase
MFPFPESDSHFLLPASRGVIEVMTTLPENNPPKGTAIICHPHPLFGGTMHNKVVTTLARVFHELGLRTVRFNFRGVGKSEGVHDQGIGETEDLLFIANWVKNHFPSESIWFAGFSFGGYVAARGASQFSVKQLVSIAPQVTRLIEAPIASITVPWIIVQGEKDEIVSPEAVYAWVETLISPPIVIRVPEAGHFFHGKLIELREVLKKTLS